MLSLSSFFIQSDGSSPNWTDCTKAGSPPASSRSPSRTQQRHATAPCSKTHANFAFLLSGCRCQNLSNIYLAGHQLGLREFSEVFNTKKLGWWSCEVSSYLQYLPPTYYDLIFSHRMVHFQFKISLPFGVLIDWCLHAFNVSNLPGWQLTSSFTIPDFIHGPKRALLKAFLPNIIVGPKSGELTPLERFAESALAKEYLEDCKDHCWWHYRVDNASLASLGILWWKVTWHAARSIPEFFQGGLKCQGADMQNICRFAGSVGTSSESEYSKRPRHDMNIWRECWASQSCKMSVHKTYLS